MLRALKRPHACASGLLRIESDGCLLRWRGAKYLALAAGLWFRLGLRRFLGFFLAFVFASHG